MTDATALLDELYELCFEIPTSVRFVRAQELVTALRSCVPQWHGIESAPKNGTPMLAGRSVRYMPYKPDGKRQMGAAGRWQEWGGYGWRNCDAPEQWSPAPPSLEVSGAGVIARSVGRVCK